jgi:geranylgeranyl reductase family protein
MNAMAVDVAVVGSGPAGALAAYACARRGLRVALIDKQTFPRDKPCGDGLGPGVVQLVRDAGLGEIFTGKVPVSAVTVHGPNGVVADTAIPSIDGQLVAGFVVPRLEFDQRLHTAALQAGADDLSGWKLTATALCPRYRSVRLRRAGGEEELAVQARLVVGADGAYSVLRRALGVAPSAPRHTGIALRAYAATDAFDPGGRVEPRLWFEFHRQLLPAYGWVFPTGRGLVNLGVGVPLRVLRRRHQQLRNLLGAFVQGVRERGVGIGDPYGLRAHLLPHAGGLPRLAHARAVLIGDAASMINPLSGEGIVYGMAAAASVTAGLPGDLGDGAALGDALAGFERHFRHTYRRHLVSCLAAQQLLRSPRWTSLVVNAAGHDQRVLRDTIDLLFGVGHLRPRTVARILRCAGTLRRGPGMTPA